MTITEYRTNKNITAKYLLLSNILFFFKHFYFLEYNNNNKYENKRDKVCSLIKFRTLITCVNINTNSVEEVPIQYTFILKTSCIV